MSRVSKAGQITQLLWATPPDHFIFIDADLMTQKPGYTAPGSVGPSWKHKETENQLNAPDDFISSDDNGSDEEAEIDVAGQKSQ
jgi:hypothetical protein